MINANFNLKNNVNSQLQIELKKMKIQQLKENINKKEYMSKAINKIAENITFLTNFF